MPNYKMHLFGALLIYLLILIFGLLTYTDVINITYAVQGFISILAGSLFPDIDIKSKGQKIFYRILFCILVLCLVYKAHFIASAVALVAFLPLTVKHRGLFHKWWFLLLLVLAITETLVCYFPLYKKIITINASFFFLGIISHLWLDLGLKRMFRLR